MKRQLLEDIISGIKKNGCYEVSVAMLETILKQGDRRHPQTKKEIFSWAAEKKFDYEYSEGQDGKIIRFFRKES